MKKKKLKDVKSGKTITGQPRDEIVLNPKQVTARFNEALTKHAVITFGRMNPPTIGHQLLADKLVAEARKVRGTALIYLSHSQDSKKNPLQYEEKIKIAKAAFGHRTVVSSRARTIIEILKEVQRSFDSVTMVVGSDRIKEFERILNTYNGRDFKFESVNVISSGQRDPDDQGVRGMSASKMRQLAEKKDAAGFKRGLPNSLKSMSDMILEMVRAGLKLNEELEAIEAEDLMEGGVLSLASRRKKAISVRKHKAKLSVARARQRRKMADRGKLRKRSQRAAIRVIRKRIAGKKAGKYNKLSGAEKSAIDKRVRARSGLVKKLATRLMPAVRRKEIVRFKNKRTKKTKFRRNSMDYNFELYLAEHYDFNVVIQNYEQVTELVDKFLDHIQENAQPARYRSDQEEKNYTALEAKSEKTGISESTLIAMYEKGLTEWTEETSGTKEQYAFQKVNTFIAKYQQTNESWYQDQMNGHIKGYNAHPEDQIAARKKAAAKKTAGKWLGAGNRKPKPPMQAKSTSEAFGDSASSYNATQNAKKHAEKDGHNYHKDVSVQHKYDAYHMKKAGYTHRKYSGHGGYSYNKHGDGEKISDKHHSGVNEAYPIYKTRGYLDKQDRGWNSKKDFKRNEIEHELGHENKPSKAALGKTKKHLEKHPHLKSSVKEQNIQELSPDTLQSYTNKKIKKTGLKDLKNLQRAGRSMTKQTGTPIKDKSGKVVGKVHEQNIDEISVDLMKRHADKSVKQVQSLQKTIDDKNVPDKIKRAAKKTIDRRSKGLDKTWGAASIRNEQTQKINDAFEQELTEIYWKVNIKGMPSVYVDKQGAGMIRAELRKVLKSPEKNIIGIERAQISDVKKYFRNVAKDPKKNQQVAEDVDTFMKAFFGDYEQVAEEGGAGLIGTPMLTKKYKLATPGQGNGVLTFAVAVDGVPHSDGSGIGKPHLWNKS